MNLRLLLDTHIVLRWLVQPKSLTREQIRVLLTADRRGERFGVSAISLVEVAQIFAAPRPPAKGQLEDVFEVLSDAAKYEILAITQPIARDVPRLTPFLRDPMDAIITATAIEHGLRLVTSDQRIIDSKLVPVVN